MTAVFKYHPWEIRTQAEDRWISLMTSKSRIHGFPFLLWFLKSEKGFAKLMSWTVVFFLLNMHAHAKLLFLRTVFQTLFQISPQKKQRREIQGQHSQRWNSFLDIFTFQCKSEIRISKFKSTFPNHMHSMVARSDSLLHAFEILVLLLWLQHYQEQGEG